MKSQIALISFVLALGLAQCATVEWTGIYILESSEVEKACFPKALYISTTNDLVYYSWRWDKSESCEEQGLKDEFFASVAQKPETTVTLKNRLPTVLDKTVVTITIGEKISFETTSGAKNVVYTKRAVETKVGWAGTWVLKETPESDEECYPKDQVSISKTKTELKFSWKWDSSEFCTAAGLSGKQFDFSAPLAPGNEALLLVLLDEKKPFDEWTLILGIMQVTGENTAKYFSGLTGEELDFERKPDGGFPTIVIILIIVVVIGVGAGLYLKNKKKEGSGSNTYLKA